MEMLVWGFNSDSYSKYYSFLALALNWDLKLIKDGNPVAFINYAIALDSNNLEVFLVCDFSNLTLTRTLLSLQQHWCYSTLSFSTAFSWPLKDISQRLAHYFIKMTMCFCSPQKWRQTHFSHGKLWHLWKRCALNVPSLNKCKMGGSF